MSRIPAIGTWANNGELIADVAALGWITDDHTVLDVTYGNGRFWSIYRPTALLGLDKNPAKSTDGMSHDFRSIPFPGRSWDVVVFDPPYRLNGTPDLGTFDDDYGIERRATWRDRMQLIADGTTECARVAKRNLIVKCQDQVVSGAMRWQTDVITDIATAAGFRKADRFEFQGGGGIPQPNGKTQRHALHAGTSQLLVFRRGKVDNGIEAQ